MLRQGGREQGSLRTNTLQPGPSGFTRRGHVCWCHYVQIEKARSLLAQAVRPTTHFAAETEHTDQGGSFCTQAGQHSLCMCALSFWVLLLWLWN